MKNVFYYLAVASIFSGCTKPTVACFTFSPATVSPNQAVTFNASCSQNAYRCTWNFGDKTPDTSANSLTMTHKFSNTGQFTVTLTAERKDGITWKKGKPTITQIITVQ